jgi:hypothetical protein
MKVFSPGNHKTKKRLPIKFHFKFKSPLWLINFILISLSFISFIAINLLAIRHPVHETIYEALMQRGYFYYASSKVGGTIQLIKNFLIPQINTSLPTIYFDIKQKHWLKLLDARAQGKTIRDAVTIPAHIRHGDKKIKVKIRNKGLRGDHRNSDKLSLRIAVKKGESLFGIREFAIQHPKIRDYLYEWAYHKNLRTEGVLAIRYDFINVVINGSPQGIYALEEHFSKELLESQNRRDGVIVRMSLDQHPYHLSTKKFFNFYAHYTNSQITAHKYKRIIKQKNLRNQYQIGRQMLEDFQMNKKAISKLFDIPITARYLAITELWNACHAQAFGNIRFYYNPVSGLLEPIGFDAGISPTTLWEPPLCTFNNWEVSLQFMTDPKMVTAFEEELYRVTSPEYIHKLRENFVPEYNLRRDDFLYEFPYIPSGKAIFDQLEKRAKILHKRGEMRTLINHGSNNIQKPHHGDENTFLPDDLPFQVTYGYFFSVLGDTIDSKSFRIRLANSFAEPNELIGIEINTSQRNDFIKAEDLILKSSPILGLSAKWLPAKRLRRPFTYRTYKLPRKYNLKYLKPENLKIFAVTKGITNKENKKSPINFIYTIPENTGRPEYPPISSELSKHPFLIKGKGNTLIVKKGVWNVTGDLMIPSGYLLHIEAGVTLKFSKHSIFISSSSTEFQGTKEEPIFLSSIAKTWGGFASLNAGPSKWTHVHVNNTEGVKRNGWELSGGVNFYKTQIHLDGIKISDNKSEDGLNIIQSKFILSNCFFSNSISDAFDGDFVDGKINNCIFKNIGGDAIDFSGSKIQANSIVFKQIKDKAVSAGEKSHLEVSNLEITGSGTGIASKDASYVKVSDSNINNASFAGLAAYIKKLEYDTGGTIETINLKIINSKKIALAQTGSQITFNDNQIETTDIDIDQLYETGAMRK